MQNAGAKYKIYRNWGITVASKWQTFATAGATQTQSAVKGEHNG